jgi:hypothetical protein
MSDWRKPYAVLWEIAHAATLEDLERLWDERKGLAQVNALRRRAWKFMQSPWGRPWGGRRAIEKLTVSDDDLRKALNDLHRRVHGAQANPVFADPRAATIQGAILDLIAGIMDWNENRP